MNQWGSMKVAERFRTLKAIIMRERHQRFDDDQAHELALELLAAVAGSDCLSQVCWDCDHHLQGHVVVGGQHLVVIAPRDDEHAPLVLPESEWDALRRGALTAV